MISQKGTGNLSFAGISGHSRMDVPDMISYDGTIESMKAIADLN